MFDHEQQYRCQFCGRDVPYTESFASHLAECEGLANALDRAAAVPESVMDSLEVQEFAALLAHRRGTP